MDTKTQNPVWQLAFHRILPLLPIPKTEFINMIWMSVESFSEVAVVLDSKMLQA